MDRAGSPKTLIIYCEGVQTLFYRQREACDYGDDLLKILLWRKEFIWKSHCFEKGRCFMISQVDDGEEKVE